MEDRIGPQRHGYASEEPLCPRPPSKGQGRARAATPCALQSLEGPWALHASFHTTINGRGRPRAAVVATIWLRVTMCHVVGQAPWLLDSHGRALKTENTIQSEEGHSQTCAYARGQARATADGRGRARAPHTAVPGHKTHRRRRAPDHDRQRPNAAKGGPCWAPCWAIAAGR